MELNEQQKQAVKYNGSAKNILVTAGAGCGKTRTIIARVAHLIESEINPSRILMMTFTNRAAREMKVRLKAEIGQIYSQIHAGTFHFFCLKVMTKIPNSFDISGLNIIDSDDQNSLMTIVRKLYISKNEKDMNKELPKASELIKYYSYSRNTCQEPLHYLLQNTDINEHHIEVCCKIFNEYQKAKKDRGYLDYDDLLETFSKALGKKPELKKAVGRLFDEVLVDEMQDTNQLQFSILKHFSDQDIRLFCVGDPAQSIYKFRGAEFKHVYKFNEMFGNSVTIPLSLNYRSYQEVLDFSNWLLDKSPFDYSNKLIANRGKNDFLPIISEFHSVQDEASWIADKIIDRNESDINLKDVMILVRSGFDAKPIEAEFIQRKIPYCFIGGTSLTKSAHVRDVLSLLRIARNNKDDLAWMRFLQLWPRVGEKTAEKIINALNEKTDPNIEQILSEYLGVNHKAITAYNQIIASQTTPRTCVFNAVHSLTPILKEKYDKWNYRIQDLKLLITVSERYKSISGFIDAFTLEPMTSTEIEKLEIDDAVLIITVHSAKGTEAPICFVVNARQGTYPHSRSCGDIEAEEEERRVLYVALTRAKNELYITRSADSHSGFYVQNKPTKGEEYFLSDVPVELVTKETHGWNSDNIRGLSSLRDVY